MGEGPTFSNDDVRAAMKSLTLPSVKNVTNSAETSLTGPICGDDLNECEHTNDDLIRHQGYTDCYARHPREKSFSCPICRENLSTYLEKHKLKDTEKDLARHEGVHTGERTLNCSKRDKKCDQSRSNTLEKRNPACTRQKITSTFYMKGQSRNGAFDVPIVNAKVNPICGENFNQSTEMEKHKRTHTEEDLATHESAHTGGKTLNCSKRDTKFNQSRSNILDKRNPAGTRQKETNMFYMKGQSKNGAFGVPIVNAKGCDYSRSRAAFNNFGYKAGGWV